MKTDLDITSNIRKIEKLKAVILSLVSRLYEDMLKMSSANKQERKYILANLVASVYLLACRLGENYEDIDDLIIKNLRAELLEGGSEMNFEAEGLLKHINKRKA